MDQQPVEKQPGTRKISKGRSNFVTGIVMLVLAVLDLAFGVWASTSANAAKGQGLGIFMVFLVIGIFCAGLGWYNLHLARKTGYGTEINDEAILREVQGQDLEMRQKAAALLFLVEDPRALEIEPGLLSDQDSTIWIHALRALLNSKAGKAILTRMIVSQKPEDKDVCNHLINGIAFQKGQAQPVSQSITSEVKSGFIAVLANAVQASPSVETNLSILEALGRLKRRFAVLYSVKSKERFIKPALSMPKRCCACGMDNPTEETLLRSAYTSSSSRASYGKLTTTTYTRDYQLPVPICHECHERIGDDEIPDPRERAQSVWTMERPCMAGKFDALTLRFDDPTFTAELLFLNKELELRTSLF